MATAAAEQALGLARAKGFAAQRGAIGADQTALVAALREVGTGGVKIVPDIQVGADAGVLGGLGAMLMRTLSTNSGGAADALPDAGDNGYVGEEHEEAVAYEEEPVEAEPALEAE
ncbi:MAG: hypothetical protein ACRD12_15885, partial [Acidimicrobiales bacterium]